MALVLAACDAGNSLWDERLRPKQLTVSSQFREHNLWMALEAAVGQWSETNSQVPCEAWPKKIPESGGICLFEGRLKDLARGSPQRDSHRGGGGRHPAPQPGLLDSLRVVGRLAVGRAAAEPFKVGLRRRRYDWAWNATALSSTFRHLADMLPAGTPMLGLLAEPEPPFATSVFTAAESSGFDLTGLALRSAQDPMQTTWTHVERDASRASFTRDLEPARRSIGLYLGERGEPAPYLHIHATVLTELAAAHALKAADEELDESLRKTNALIESALTGGADFVHHSNGEGVETGMWNLRNADLSRRSEDSLADRVEMATVTFLQKNPDSLYLEIEADLYARFPGLLTPSKGYDLQRVTFLRPA